MLQDVGISDSADILDVVKSATHTTNRLVGVGAVTTPKPGDGSGWTVSSWPRAGKCAA
jgi:hypothetical protein